VALKLHCGGQHYIHSLIQLYKMVRQLDPNEITVYMCNRNSLVVKDETNTHREVMLMGNITMSLFSGIVLAQNHYPDKNVVACTLQFE